jgi:hypothetical protein
MEKRQSLNKCCWEKWLFDSRKLRQDPCLSPCTSIKSKWVKDLNFKPENLQLVHKRVGNTLEAIGIGKDFLSWTLAPQQLRERMDKWHYMKLKGFCTTQEIGSKLKRPPTGWEKIFASYTADKGLINQNIQGAQKTKLCQNQ